MASWRAGASLLLGLTLACGGGKGPIQKVPDDVELCRDHMRSIYRGLREYRERFGHAPRSGGVAFLAELIASGVWEDTPENRALLQCPGPHAQPPPEEIDWSDPGSLEGNASSYAARDVEKHPMEFPAGGRVPVLACDNAAGMNHDGLMNVLYADGSIRTFIIEEMIERHELPPGTKVLSIGEGSPLEDLRVLSPD